MTRRRNLLVVGCVLLVAMAALVIFFRSQSLSYEGKSINQWLAWFDSPSGLSPAQWEERVQKRSEATYALRQMGPRVFPHLRRMLQPAPGMTKFLHQLASQMRREHMLVGTVVPPSPEEARMLRAVEACSGLGRDAQVMTSDLLLAVRSNRYANVRSRAAFALGNMGGAPALVVPALVESLSNHVDGNILIALGKYGADAGTAVPAIRGVVERIETNLARNNASDKNALCEAVRALHQIAPQEAEKRLPLLRRVLQQEQDPFWQSRLAEVVDTISGRGSVN